MEKVEEKVYNSINKIFLMIFLYSRTHIHKSRIYFIKGILMMLIVSRLASLADGEAVHKTLIKVF